MQDAISFLEAEVAKQPGLAVKWGGQARDYQGGAHPPSIQGRVLGIADITGDWREEVIWRHDNNSDRRY